jgi:hypothetical protein
MDKCGLVLKSVSKLWFEQKLEKVGKKTIKINLFHNLENGIIPKIKKSYRRERAVSQI